MPKHSSQIVLLRSTGGCPLPRNPFSEVVLSSACTSWQGLMLEQHHFSRGQCDVNEELMYMQHVIAVNIGPPISAQYRKDGRFLCVNKPLGAISLYPSQRPFFRRVATRDI